MPTNLPPHVKALEKKVLAARTTAEKIKALEEYLAAIPDHKGTAKLRANVKKRIAKLRLELEEERRKRAAVSVLSGKFAIKKEGAAQVVLLGLANSGKSSVLAALTNAKPLISERPFTTTEPVPGMMSYEDVQIQLVEAPPIFEGASEGEGWGPKSLSLSRNADAIALVVDLSQDPVEQFGVLKKELENSRVALEPPSCRIEFEKRGEGGISLVAFGELEDDPQLIKEFLREAGVRNAVIRIWGKASLQDVLRAVTGGYVHKPAVVVANKVDVPGSREKLRLLLDAVEGKVAVVPFSAKTGEGVEELKKAIFSSLDIVRVYTKPPKGPKAEKPIVVKKGTTVIEVAKIVHSDLYERFSYARIWGASAKFPGEKVGANHVLMDGDVVEIHIR